MPTYLDSGFPYLVIGKTHRLETYIDSPSGTPTWKLLVNGQTVVTATNGVNLGSDLWRFDVAVPSNATVGQSARVVIEAQVGGDTWKKSFHSAITAPVKLIEQDKPYVYSQNEADELNKTANVTISEPV
jgi:hypothetical protein